MKMIIIILLGCAISFLDTLTAKGFSINDSNHTRHRRQIRNFECTLPSYPQNGRWTVVNSGASARPGDKIPINSFIMFQCSYQYKLSSKNAYWVCDRSWATLKLPECEKLCPPLYSTNTTTLSCVDKREKEVNCEEAADGAVLTFECAKFYELPGVFKRTIRCVKGAWGYPRSLCQPACGKSVNEDSVQLISRGRVQEKLEFPWIVAIFYKFNQNDRYKNICSGSILSRSVILTAAHCTTDDNGEPLLRENFIIGAGKVYNEFNHTEDKEAQYKEISKIIVHPAYGGATRNLYSDLAILITKDHLKLTYLVQPICFNNVDKITLTTRSIGVVSGWGNTEDSVPSEKLRTLEIPYRNETQCAQELPTDFEKKYNIGKLCAGFLNQNRSVCSGDSGGGFAFRNPEDNRYYIHGIVSVAPFDKDRCNIQQNALYTRVSLYYKFIDNILSSHYTEDCMLPPYPQNGIWRVSGGKMPGANVSPDTVLEVSCNEGFLLSSRITEFQCQEVILNMPQCDLLYPSDYTSIPSTSTTTIPSTTSAYDVNDLIDLRPFRQAIKCLDDSGGFPNFGCISELRAQTSRILPKVICTYSSWESLNGINPEDLNATLCNYMVYAFAEVSSDGTLKVRDETLDIEKRLYHRVTEMKKRNDKLKVLLSVREPEGKKDSVFSLVAGNISKRTAFVESATDFLQTYNFDGLDIDWSYPSVKDKINYIKFIKRISETFEENKWLIAATVQSDPDATGYEPPRMNALLDWINIKSYDMYGNWSPYTGHNSPLYPSSSESDWEKQHLNMDAVAKKWLAAGLSKEKIVVSVAFYGRSFVLLDKSKNGIHASIKGAGLGKDGVLRYSEICEKYSNWTRIWDQEQQNPYKYFEDNWISYDDDESVRIKFQCDEISNKAVYVKENNYLGVNVWPIDADDIHGKCGTKQILLKQVYDGLTANITKLED